MPLLRPAKPPRGRRTRDGLIRAVGGGEAGAGPAGEILPDVIARFDRELRVLSLNAAIEPATGRLAAEFLGKTPRELGLPAARVKEWETTLRGVFTRGQAARVEFSWTTPCGRRTFECRLAAEPAPGAGRGTVVAVARDVTAEHRELAAVRENAAATTAENSALFAQMKASTSRLQLLARRLVEAQETERRHIARELHDEAGQALASLRFGLRLLERAMEEGASVTGRVAELMERTDAVIDGLHRLAADLRPASLDHLGLDAALRQYTRSAAAKYGLAVHFKARGFTRERLPAEVETALYRVVQEAMTNVVRHAQATRVDVLVERRGNGALVMVEDDGVGFVPEQAQSGDHVGLLGSRERAEALGGTLTVESSPGAGTTVVVEVPSALPHPDR